MDDKTCIAKSETWRGILAVRLPSAMVERFDRKERDDLEIAGVGGCDPERGQDPDSINPLGRLPGFRGRMTGDFGFDRNEANEF